MTTRTEEKALVVSLWLVDPAAPAPYERFEREAAALMAEHGGCIERVIRTDDQNADTPFEIHLVRFETDAGFAAYRADPRVAAMAERREALIARTEVVTGRALPAWGSVR